MAPGLVQPDGHLGPPVSPYGCVQGLYRPKSPRDAGPYGTVGAQGQASRMALASHPASRMVHSGDPAGEPLYTSGPVYIGDLGLYKGLRNIGGSREGPEGPPAGSPFWGSGGSMDIHSSYIP